MPRTSIIERFYPDHRQAIANLAAKMKVPEEAAVVRLAELGLHAAGLTTFPDPEPILEAIFGKSEKMVGVFNTLADAHNEAHDRAMEVERADYRRWSRERRPS